MVIALETLGYQHDIFQRYTLLRLLIDGLLRQRSDPAVGERHHERPEVSDTADLNALELRVLDVGSGPARLCEAFLPPLCKIVRADIDQFGDESIVKLSLDEPWP